VYFVERVVADAYFVERSYSFLQTCMRRVGQSRRPNESLHRVEVLRGDEGFVYRESFDRRTAVFESLAQAAGRNLVSDDRLDRLDDGRHRVSLAASGRRGRLREQLRERRLDVRGEVDRAVAVT